MRQSGGTGRVALEGVALEGPHVVTCGCGFMGSSRHLDLYMYL